MRKKYFWMLITSFVLSAGGFITSRFIVKIPDPIAIILLICSVVLIVIYLVKNR